MRRFFIWATIVCQLTESIFKSAGRRQDAGAAQCHGRHLGEVPKDLKIEAV
ncbi:MAG TPA: hypothetical protein VNU93_05805 [Verrucomicrobiae bacterium]|nr:hypothetical protein [Verrucomicrobiae bacterium]